MKKIEGVIGTREEKYLSDTHVLFEFSFGNNLFKLHLWREHVAALSFANGSSPCAKLVFIDQL
jgi:hypothetical protein